MDVFNRYALRVALALICSIPAAPGAQSLAVLYPNHVIRSPVSGCDTTHFGGDIDMCGSKATISSGVATFLYNRIPTTGQWIRWAQLDAKHGDAFFGQNAEVHNNVAVVTASSAALGLHLDVLVNEGGIWRLRQALPNAIGRNAGHLAALSARWLVLSVRRGCDEEICTFDEYHGFIHVYERQSNGTFAFSARLVPSDRGPPQFPSHAFGASVAASGDTLLVGAPGDRNLTGAVFVFKFQSGSWREVQKIRAANPRPSTQFGQGAEFGHTVRVHANLAAIGAFGDLPEFIPNPVPPAVHMFAHNGTIWQEKQRLLHPEPEIFHTFGDVGIGLDLQRVVIGATSRTAGELPRAYVFERSGVQWTPTAKLLGSDFGFGNSIHLSGNVVLAALRGREPCAPDMVNAYDLYRYATR